MGKYAQSGTVKLSVTHDTQTMKPPGSKTKAQIWVVENSVVRSRPDQIATEEPLEIRLSPKQTVAVTMRTPGADFDLAAGFLYSEGVVSHREDIRQMSYCVASDVDAEQRYNIVNVTLKEGLLPDLQPLERHFFTTSACGVCGKASIEALQIRGCPVIPTGMEVTPEVIYSLPDKLRGSPKESSPPRVAYTLSLSSTLKGNS